MRFRLDGNKDALFLDIDGTLLDIAPEAKAVRVPTDLKEDLAALLEKLGGALALVSGRTIENIDDLFAPLRLSIAGVHGAEWRLSPDAEPRFFEPLPLAFRRSVFDAFRDWPELIVEDKIRSVAVHYRQASQKAALVEEIMRKMLEGQTLSLKTIRGRKVFEVTGAGFDKGKAVETFMRESPFVTRSPFFIGDDITDLEGMAACVRFGGRGAKVGHGRKEEGCAFASPAEVRGWIKKQARTL